MGSLAVVLGILAGALWAVKRYNIRLPGATGARSGRRIALVERTGIDARRSIALIRRDGREHLILLAPEGNLVIESSIVTDDLDRQAAEAQAAEAEERARAAQAVAAQAQESFKDMVSAVIEGSSAVRGKIGGLVERAHARTVTAGASLAVAEGAGGVDEAGPAAKRKPARRVRMKPESSVPTAEASQPQPLPRRAPVLLKVTNAHGDVVQRGSLNA
jgi:flagellar biogenesis protein FliO